MNYIKSYSLDTNSFTRLIKDECLSLGFSKVGIAKAEYYPEDKEVLGNWIDKNYNASMHWITNNQEKRTNISNYYSDSKSVISVAINYFNGSPKDDHPPPYISNYASGIDYHIIIKSKLKEVLEKINYIDSSIHGYFCADTSPVMERAWAQRAGLGWIGKHTNLITKEFGSWVFLGELIINKTLDYDAPFTQDLCGNCNLCIEECPTDAIVDSFQIDSNKCISYVTIEKRGEFEEENSIKLDDWIFGCDVCQDVCPWNIKFSVNTLEEDFSDRFSLKSKDYNYWENLTEEEYRKVFKNSAVKRTKFSGLKRNILYAKEQSNNDT